MTVAPDIGSVLDELAALQETREVNVMTVTDDLAMEIAAAELDVAEAERQLKRAKDNVTRLKRDMVSAAARARQTSFVVDSGYRVEVKETWKGSISKERAKRAFQWLREHGHGSLITSQVTVSFKTGQDSLRNDLLKLLKTSGIKGRVAVKEAVHHKRVTSLVGELARDGKLGEEPSELLAAFPVKTVTVKKSE